jgi:hypothetical protein
VQFIHWYLESSACSHFQLFLFHHHRLLYHQRCFSCDSCPIQIQQNNNSTTTSSSLLVVATFMVVAFEIRILVMSVLVVWEVTVKHLRRNSVKRIDVDFVVNNYMVSRPVVVSQGTQKTFVMV